MTQAEFLPGLWSAGNGGDDESHFQWDLPQPQAVRLHLDYITLGPESSPQVQVKLVTEQRSTAAAHDQAPGDFTLESSAVRDPKVDSSDTSVTRNG